MKVLVVGAGGREHAIAWALRRAASVSEVVVAPGNDGMVDVARVVGGGSDIDALVAVATRERPDLVVVGPEAPLTLGLADRLRAEGFDVFGPGAAGARLEGSKSYAKAFMERHGVPTAGFAAFTDLAAAREHLDRVGAPIVVKDSRLAAGKGVTVATDLAALHVRAATTSVDGGTIPPPTRAMRRASTGRPRAPPPCARCCGSSPASGRLPWTPWSRRRPS